MSIERPKTREELKQAVLEQFLVKYEEKMISESGLYDEDDLSMIEKLAQGEKIRWDVQGADLLAKICQDFRLTSEEGIALRVQIFEDAKVPGWYTEEI